MRTSGDNTSASVEREHQFELAPEDLNSDSHLQDTVDALVQSYQNNALGKRIDRRRLPSRGEVAQVIELLLEVFYPGYFGQYELTQENLSFHLGYTLASARDKLTRLLELSLAHDGNAQPQKCAAQLGRRFVSAVPALRQLVLSDVQEALDSVPGVHAADELILAYPGVMAITVHRIAHLLHSLEVPLLPRMMSEWVYVTTGAEIDPSMTVGASFFLERTSNTVAGEHRIVASTRARAMTYQI